MLTLVGEIVSSQVHSYQDRRTGRTAYRLDTVLRDRRAVAADVVLRQGQGHGRSWNATRLRVGRRGIFVGKVGSFRGEWQLTNPQMALFGTTEEDAAHLSLDTLGELYPIYPLTKGLDSWDLQRAVSFALTVLEDVPETLPETRPRGLRPHRRAHRAAVDPRAERLGADQPGPAPVPLRGGPGHPARARAAASRAPGAGLPAAHRRGRRPARRLRRAPALRAHRAASARSVPRSRPTWPDRTR